MVSVLRNYEEINMPIKDVKVGDLVASYNEELKANFYEPIIVKLTHHDYVQNNQLELHSIQFKSSSKNGVLELTNTHFVYARRGKNLETGVIEHFPCSQIEAGDQLLITEKGYPEWATVFSKEIKKVNPKDVIQVYTESRNILANGLHASCVNINDESEITIPFLAAVAKYVSPDLAQSLAEFAVKWGMKSLYQNSKSMVKSLFFY